MVFLQRDLVIILANGVSLCLLLGILYFKLREHRQGSRSSDCCSSPGVTKIVDYKACAGRFHFCCQRRSLRSTICRPSFSAKGRITVQVNGSASIAWQVKLSL
jgi:hypothetical protein